MNTIITIGRQFGSGGHEIGEELAKCFNIKCYDKELLKAKLHEFYQLCAPLVPEEDEEAPVPAKPKRKKKGTSS